MEEELTDTVPCDWKLETNIKWWRLDLTADRPLMRYHKQGLSGLTIVGFSDQERKAIRRWCKQQEGVHKLTNVHTFHDVIHFNHVSNIGNYDHCGSLDFMESEMCAFGCAVFIDRLQQLVAALPKREYETWVYGLTSSEIQRICRRTPHRILTDINDDTLHIVSVADKHVLFELKLLSHDRRSIP